MHYISSGRQKRGICIIFPVVGKKGGHMYNIKSRMQKGHMHYISSSRQEGGCTLF